MEWSQDYARTSRMGGLSYLFKLKQTKKVKELIALCELDSEWESAPGNWQHCESRLQLTGGDNENCYDELKKRSRVTSNWQPGGFKAGPYAARTFV